MQFVMKQGHGGGCILTEAAFARRLTKFENDGFLSPESFLPKILFVSRFIYVSSGFYVFIGRD